MKAERRGALIPYLGAESCEIRQASDCREARGLLRQEYFDVVFTDASLPDGNWLTISRASNQGDAPPALIVCLPRQAERLASILGAGHVQVLMPPLDGATLRAALEAALCSQQIPPRGFMAEPHCAPLQV